MNNVDRYESRKGRKLVVDDVEWKWVYGGTYVRAYSATGMTKLAHACDIMGITPEEWSRRKWKQSSSQALTPEMVADWIKYT